MERNFRAKQQRQKASGLAMQYAESSGTCLQP